MGDKVLNTQFSIRLKTKNKLDLFKAKNKETIIKALKLKRQAVTNSEAIDYLLLNQKSRRGKK